jgi:hypothetical protein
MVHVQQIILIYKKEGFRYGFPSKPALLWVKTQLNIFF